MVVADEVQNAVREQVSHFIQQRTPPRASLSGSGVEGHDHVAEKRRTLRIRRRIHGKCEHVGGLRFAAMLTIEPLDVRVVREQYAELSLRDAEIGEHSIGARSHRSRI